MAVTGYVDFIPTMQGVPFNRPFPDFIPCIHVSGITACAPNKNLYPLGLTLAADVFLAQNIWRLPKHMKKLAEIIGTIVIMLLIVNCGGGNGNNKIVNYGDNNKSDLKHRTNVHVRLTIKDKKSNKKRMKTSRIKDIASITLDVNSSRLFYVKDLPFKKNGNAWEIDLQPLPIGETLTFYAKGYDKESSLIYEGVKTLEITADNNVTLELVAIKDKTRDLPTVENIAIYKDINHTRLSFKILNRNRDNLQYLISPIDNNGKFDPNSGSMLFNIDRELLNVIYIEPKEAGNYKNSITLTNENEDKFISIFTINVSETSDINVTLNVAPHIDSLEVTNDDNNLTLRAIVIDDDNNATQLNYHWEILKGDVTMENNSSKKNPLIITSYDASDILQIKLTVSDNQGASSSVTYNIDGKYTNLIPEEFEFLFLSHYSTGDELWKIKKDKKSELIKTFNNEGKDGIGLNYDMVKIGNNYFFVANTPTGGKELWRSDGTLDGTFMIKDIIEGEVGSDPKNLTAVNDTLYFTANDGMHGRELWKTDGSEKTTILVKDIRTGTQGSNPNKLINLHGTLIFVADDGTHQAELWKSDGTSNGTSLIKDIYKEKSSNPTNLVYNKSKKVIYFVANDGTHGRELWRCDGTSTGTVMVKDIFPGNSDSHIDYLTNIDGILYFSASDKTIRYKINNGANNSSNFRTVYNQELWRSNGVQSGTFMVKDIKDITDNHTPPKSGSGDETKLFTQIFS
jgi:ELWxxDGT repeat protein